MSLDSSLKNRGGLKGNRSVYTRTERIMKMQEIGKFDEEKDSPFGLPKLSTQHSKAGSKAKKEEAPAEETEGTEATEGAEGTEEASAEK